MFKSYLLVALRSFTKHKGYAATNIFGLTLGITAFILIGVYVAHELNYDKFHPQGEQVYRLNNTYDFQGEQYPYPTTNSAISPALQEASRQVEAYTRLIRVGGNNATIIRLGDELYDQEDVYAAEATFFELFGFELIQGKPETVLATPNSIVLTASVAQKLFKGAEPLGQQVYIKQQLNNQLVERSFEVTGLMPDLGDNTHMNFKVLMSMASISALANQNNPEGPAFLNNWNSDGFYTYLRLQEGSTPEAVLSEARAQIAQNVNADQLNRYNPTLTALQDIHLKSAFRNEMQPNGNMAYLTVFTVTGLFLLVLAVINYMNLATARSAHRAREVGIRKIMGALRINLIGQFLGESTLLTFFSAILSLGMATVLLPFFNQMTSKAFVAADLFSPLILTGLLLIILLVGIGSGLYPSFFLSSFQPATVLKGALSARGGGTFTLRRVLVVFQFAISIMMILGTLMVYRQLDYLRHKDLGFNKEAVIAINNSNNALSQHQQLQLYKTALLADPKISSVSATLSKPGGLRPIIQVRTEETAEDQDLTVAGINVDFDYLETMGMAIKAGRNFDPRLQTDSTEAIIINKRMIGYLGLPDDPIESVVEINAGNGVWQRKKVIGVVEDVNFEPLNRKTEEAFYANLFPAYSYILVKLRPGEFSAGIAKARQTWAQMVPGQPFSYSFIEDDLYQLYEKEERLSNVVLYYAILNVLIACLGLFGLASFATEQRTKEIGVRKVLGASAAQITYLIAREFILLVGLAFLIGAPVAWYFINDWLQSFVYHATISWLLFALALGGALVLALLTVGYRTLRAALADPVRAIKYE